MSFETRPEPRHGYAAAQGQRPITLTIASDRPALLGALVRRLAREDDVKLVQDPVLDPSLLLDHLDARLPKLLLLDEVFLDRLGVQAMQLHRQFPALDVLLVCDSARPELVERIIASRFCGFVLVNECDSLVRAIRRVAQGDLWLPRWLLAKALYRRLHSDDDPTVDERRASDSDRRRAPKPDPRLTKRETQVVGQLRQGQSNKEIAQKLGIQEDTVKKHLLNVFRKVGIRRRSQLLLGGIRQRFLVDNTVAAAARNG